MGEKLVAAEVLAAIRAGNAIVCFTKCWPCQFGEHNTTWHSWADLDDIAHAAATGQPDPSGQRCGCHCCATAAPTTTPPPVCDGPTPERGE